MKRSEAEPRRAGLWAVAILSLFAWAPALHPGYWAGLEGFLPIFNVAAPAALANVGVAPDLWRGTGLGALSLAQPLLLLGFSSLTAVKVVFASCFVLGGLGVYVWLHPRLGDRAAGLAGVVYMLLPVFLATVYVRGNLGDALLLALLPLALAGLAAYRRQRSMLAAGVAVLAIFWMWRTQAGLAFFATLALLAYALAAERSGLAALTVAVSGAAGALSLWPLRALQGAPPVAFGDHFVYFYQLLRNGWEVAPSAPGWQDGYPFQLGAVALAFAVAGLWLLVVQWRSRPLAPGGASLLAFCAGAVALLTLLTLGLSAPFWNVTGAGRLLTYPWQLAVVAAPFLAALAGALPALVPALERPALWAALVALAVLGSYAFLQPAYTQVAPPDRPLALFGDNQLALLSAELTEAPDGTQAELVATWQVLHPLDFDANVFFQALTSADSGDSADTPQVVAQLDAQPVDGLPATQWQPGAIVTARYTLALPPEAQAAQGADVRYYFGFYDWRDGARLPVDGGPDDKLVFDGP
jgi:hypothetical protein